MEATTGADGSLSGRDDSGKTVSVAMAPSSAAAAQTSSPKPYVSSSQSIWNRSPSRTPRQRRALVAYAGGVIAWGV